MHMHFEKSSSCYLIPTIHLLSHLIVWDDENGGWRRDIRSFYIGIEFLCFSCNVEIDYKVRRKKR